MAMSLNRRVLWIVETLLAQAEDHRVAVHSIEGGGQYVDCGIEARGGLLAGIEMARVCLADLAEVSIVPGEIAGRSVPASAGRHRSPGAGLPGQSSMPAGRSSDGKYFAMGSGPMRAAAGTEAIFDDDRVPGAGDVGGRRARNAQAAAARDRRQDRRRLPGRAPPPSLCWPRRPPAWPAGCRSWPVRSRRPCTSLPS